MSLRQPEYLGDKKLITFPESYSTLLRIVTISRMETKKVQLVYLIYCW